MIIIRQNMFACICLKNLFELSCSHLKKGFASIIPQCFLSRLWINIALRQSVRIEINLFSIFSFQRHSKKKGIIKGSLNWKSAKGNLGKKKQKNKKIWIKLEKTSVSSYRNLLLELISLKKSNNQRFKMIFGHVSSSRNINNLSIEPSLSLK